MFVSPSPIDENLLLATLDPPAMFIPIGATPVSAGFPSPAEDYAQKLLPAARIRTNLASLIGGVERAPSEP